MADSSRPRTDREWLQIIATNLKTIREDVGELKDEFVTLKAEVQGIQRARWTFGGMTSAASVFLGLVGHKVGKSIGL